MIVVSDAGALDVCDVRLRPRASRSSSDASSSERPVPPSASRGCVDVFAARAAARSDFHALVFLLREFQILRGVVGVGIDVEGRFEKRNRLGELFLVVQRQTLLELLLPTASCCLPASSCCRICDNFCTIAVIAGERGAIFSSCLVAIVRVGHAPCFTEAIPFLAQLPFFRHLRLGASYRPPAPSLFSSSSPASRCRGSPEGCRGWR